MTPHICVITATWLRPELYEVFARNMAELKPAPAVVCMGSPGDLCEDIAHKWGHVYAQSPNQMGLKWNAACKLAKRHVKADYYLFMGSDDLMDQRCFDYYMGYKGDHLALRDYFFHNVPTGQTLHWRGYRGERKGEPIGAGKLVCRGAMEEMDWKPFYKDRPNALDYDMHHKLLNLGVTIDVVTLRQTGGISVDLKTPENATPWKRIAHDPQMVAVSLKTSSPQLWRYISMIPRTSTRP